MKPEHWRQRHGERCAAAVGAAQRLCEGGDLAGCSALRGWRFAGDPMLLEVFTRRLLAVEPGANDPRFAALVGPLPARGHRCLQPGLVAERIRLRRHIEDQRPGGAVEPRARLAGLLYLLDLLGDEVERLERQAWGDEPYAEQVALDERAASWWALWLEFPRRVESARTVALPPLSPRTWASLHDGWRQLFRPQALKAYRAVLELVGCPSHARAQHLDRMREASFARLYSGGERYMGWVELAARVLERSGYSQVAALQGVCDSPALSRVAACAATNGTRAETVRRVWPRQPERLGRAVSLRARLESGDAFEGLLDLHVALRLADHLASAERLDLDACWRVVRQNRGRAAARLRAVVCEGCVDGLGHRLLSVPALHARTAAAVRSYFWTWGLNQVARTASRGHPDVHTWFHGEHPSLGVGASALMQDHHWGLVDDGGVRYSYDPDGDVTEPCQDDPALSSPLSADQRAALRCWVLLVIMRGRLASLQRWVGGSGGDKDGGWGRLLADELPDDLRDPPQPDGRRAGYQRLRLALKSSIPALLASLLPDLAALAALEPGRGAKAAVQAVVLPAWHPSVRFPASGFPSIIQHARGALRVLHELEASEP